MGAPDMRIPIAHALAWPGRLATQSPRLDLVALGTLEFHTPDPVRFPALRLARDALRAGGGACAGSDWTTTGGVLGKDGRGFGAAGASGAGAATGARLMGTVSVRFSGGGRTSIS